MHCTGCNFENPQDANFCTECGAPLSPLAGASRKRPTTLRGFVASWPDNWYVAEKLDAITLGLALAIGACLRFYQLGAYELTADEAGSWYPAAAPTVDYVVRVGLAVNPGRLGLHELGLHFWILGFGDSVISMRSLSAILGVIGILLVFVVARELLEFDLLSAGLPRDDSNRIAALSALVFALSLPAIHYSREARGYALVLTVALAQVYSFIRAARFGRFGELLGVSFLSFLLVAASMVNVAVLVAEGVWLLALIGVSGWRPASPLSRHAWLLAASLIPGAIAAGLMLLAGWSAVYAETQQSFHHAAVLSFMQTARMAPLNAMCALTIGLAVIGTIRLWREARAAVWLALLWMWLPVVVLAWQLRSLAPLLLVVLSIWFPSLLQRYVITCVVPFSILTAIGIRRIRPNLIRPGALALFVGLALVRIASYYRSPGDGLGQWGVQWREAAAFAASEAKAGRPISLYPEFYEFVVVYYARNSTTVPPFSPRAHLIIVTPNGGDPNDANLPLLHVQYPRDVARLNGVSVWGD